MSDFLAEIAGLLAGPGLAPLNTDAKSAAPRSTHSLGMFGGGFPIRAGARALIGAGEQTSARIASIASRGLEKPESLSLDEIKSVCASALTQTADKA